MLKRPESVQERCYGAMNTGPEPAASTKTVVSKLLSIVIMGRDDDYMLDFKYRLATSLNYIARNLNQLERLDDVEIVVTDWGSEVPLAQTLPLSVEAARICRFVYVPMSTVRAAQDGSEGFHMALAFNTGLRRASGKFLMNFAADTLLPQYSLESILQLLAGELHDLPIDADRTYFLVSRHQIPWQVVQRQPTLREWDRYLLLNAGHIPREDAALFSVSKGAGALMMHRSLWHQLRGLDEEFTGWGWHDVDLGLRATQQLPWVELSSLGVSLFHMEHAPAGDRMSRIEVPYSPVYNAIFGVNDEHWGLGGCELPVKTAQNGADIAPSGKAVTASKQPIVEGESLLCRKNGQVRIEVHHVAAQMERVMGPVLSSTGGRRIDACDAGALVFLLWYCGHHTPRTYLDFGVSHGCTAALVASICPWIEIYGVDTWNGVCYDHSPRTLAAILRRRVGHRGYLRFVNGDMGTAVQRLRDSFIGPFTPDLVLVREDFLTEEPLDQTDALLRDLAPGGGLVMTCNSAASFESVWMELETRFPHFSYCRSRTGTTGIVLAASLPAEPTTEQRGKSWCVDTQPAEAAVVACERRLKRKRVYKALRKPRRYPEYLARLFRSAANGLPRSRG